MKSSFVINKRWWNKAAPIHLRSQLYNLKDFQKGKTSLQEIEVKELGNVRRKKLLHLLCHIGMDTLSLARKGAVVTGVDLSDESISIAKKLSLENKIPARFISSNVYNLEKHLNGKFDIVYMSYGVLNWLPDLNKLAKVINHFLKNGGSFYIVEVHPFTNLLTYDFKLEYKYFKKGPYADTSSGTYTDWNAKINGKTIEWSHTISEFINVLLSVGLKIEYVHEFPFTMYDQFPGFMKRNNKGQYFLKNKKIEIPLLFSIKATK